MSSLVTGVAFMVFVVVMVAGAFCLVAGLFMVFKLRDPVES